MLSAKRGLAAVGALGIAWLTVVACGSGAPNSSTGEATTIGNDHVNVTPTATTLSAVVTDSTGAVLYTYEGVVMVGDVPAVKCELKSNGAKGYHLYPFYPSTALPSSAEFARLAYYDYVATARAYSGEDTFDNQGCDGPGTGGPGGSSSLTCTSAGGCCDTHDACYAANGCTQNSWGFNAAGWLLGGYLGNQAAGLVSKCAHCNAAAENCVIGSAFGGGPGPSACCGTSDPSSSSGNTCGQGWGEAGAPSGQCLCPPGSEEAKPGACGSSACGGNDGGAGSQEGGNGNEGGAGNEGGNGDDGGNGGGDGGAGEGDGGGGGNEGGGDYMFARRATPDRHHPITLSPGVSRTISFVWSEAAGVAAPADLWIESGGRVVLQVSSLGGHPFARAGLDAVPLAPGASYRLVLEREGDSVTLKLLDDQGNAAIGTRFRVEAPVAPDTPIADVVLPGAFWRAAITSSLE